MLPKFIFSFSFTLILCPTMEGQVRLQTGAAEINIPLYNYSDANNRITTSINLVYNAGNGLRVNQIASSVGAGWDLDLGGVITRIQNGEPDDQQQNGTFPYPTQYSSPPVDPVHYNNYLNNYYPNGFLYSEFSTSPPVDNGGGYVPLFSNAIQFKQNPIYITDREQDYFAFSFNGRTGQFVIGKNGEIKTIVDSKLKIEKVVSDMSANNIITTISEFAITDETGIKYVFKELELNEVMAYKRQYDASDINNYQITYPWTNPPNLASTIFRGEAKGRFTVGNWFLSEIVNPMTNAKIIFTYEAFSADLIGKKNCHRVVANNTTDISIFLERFKGSWKRIKNIKSSVNEEVEFIYSQTTRNDLTFGRSLDEIQIKYAGAIKFSWKFNYGYFVKGQIKLPSETFNQNQKYQSRLCLQSIQRFGTSQSFEPPFKFNYYIDVLNGNNYPYEVPAMFSVYQDHWGYSNGVGSDDDFLYEPRNDINYTNVNWNTLATLLYDQNLYRQPFFDYALAGVIQSIQYPAGGTLTYEYEQNSATIPVTLQQVTMGGVRVKKTILFDGNDHSKDIINEYKYTAVDGVSSSGWGYESPVYINSNSQKIYNCSNQKKVGVIVKEGATTFVTASAPYVVTGSGISTSLGLGVEATINNLIFNLIASILLGGFSPAYVEYSVNETYFEPLSNVNQLPFQYSRVTVENKLLSANIGKTIYEFRSATEDPVDIPQFQKPYPARQRFAYWAYGHPIRITVRDNNNNIVKVTENTYERVKYEYNNSNFLSRKWMPNKYEYNCDLFPGSGYTSSTSQIDQVTYYPLCGHIKLTQTKEYIYNQNNQNTFVTTEFEYSPLNYELRKTKTTNSKGELIENSTYYSEDYTLAGAIQEMKNKNMVGIPVSSQTLITKAGNQKYLIGGSVSEYSVLSNNDIKPIRTYRFRSDQPIAENQVSFNGNQLLPNSNYYKEIVTVDYYKQVAGVTYHAIGLPIQINSDVGKTSAIYDYNYQLPIATVVNAAVEDIAYTSFEADGKGNWEFNNSATNISDAGWITGRKVFRLQSGAINNTIVRNNLNPMKTYVVSYWAKSGSATVNSQASSPVFSTGGWSLYVHEISGVSTVSIAGTALIDELRLYLKGSMMNTITYNPIVGKTSECDANNRLTYYEYDDLNRLKIVLDHERNVMKTYEYNYKQ